MNNKKKVIIYTDGACLNNPGPGGIGIVLTYGDNIREISHGYRKTTNNRMELLAVIEALSALKTDGLDIIIVSDSSYVVDAVNKGWIFQWEQINFKKKKNPDLWIRFLELFRKQKVVFRWIEGHSGHPENERCDYLAKNAARNPVDIDPGYENMNKFDLNLFNG